MSDQKRAEEILRASEALLEGHFILTSGRHSGQYMQCARILQDPAHAGAMAEILVRRYAGESIDLVVGPATGGIIIAYELARQLRARTLFTEREDGKMVLRRGFHIPRNTRVLVAEDVITTGGSVREVIEVVREAGAQVIGVAVLVDRSMGSIDFGVPLSAAYTADVKSYQADDCPLCREGVMEAVKPGSRGLK